MAVPHYPQLSNDMPAPLLKGSIDDLLDFGDQSGRQVKTFIGHNLGYRTFTLVMPMREFYDQSAVANEVNENGEISQRPLDENHANELGKYILRGLVSATCAKYQRNGTTVPSALLHLQAVMGSQPYMSLQPIVANLRSCRPEGAGFPAERMLSSTGETYGFKVTLTQRDTLWVVDGQHRRAGMDSVFRFLGEISKTSRYPRKKGKHGYLYDYGADTTMSTEEWKAWQDVYQTAMSMATVTVDIHLGLDYIQERQLFHDLNNRGKKVERSLALSFDAANPVNSFVRDEINEKIIALEDTDRKDWAQDDGKLPIKDMVAINAHLFLNKTNAASAEPKLIAERKDVALKLWNEIAKIPGFGKPGMNQTTVAAQTVVLKALAKLTFDFAFGRKRNPEHLKILLEGIATKIDFSHHNPMWRFYTLGIHDRHVAGLTGLEKYVPVTKNLGQFTNGTMRFGVAHNDIYPTLCDMIRWKLGLPASR